MDPGPLTTESDDPIPLQLWKLIDCLPPVADVTNIVFNDPQLAIGELRLRIKAAMMELESMTREKISLMNALNDRR